MKIFGTVVLLLLAAVASSASAHQVYGAIADKWRQLGAQSGALGEPVTDERDAARGGRFNEFRNGFIYWHPSSSIGAHAVYGLIGQRWNQLGREVGFGYPITDELPAKSGGRFNDFENGGSIYWHPSSGVHVVYGAIRAKWHELGREAGALGYPVSDESAAVNGGRFNNFQFGMIYWHPRLGAHAVYGRIGENWIALGREQGTCGYPTSDEYEFDDGRNTGEYATHKRFRRSDFVNGYILWSKKRDQLFPNCGQTSPSQPKQVPPGESCSISVTIQNKACLNADGTDSTILSSGTITASGCGSSVENARSRAKQSFQQFGCLTEGNQPSPGCCTFSEQVEQRCLCR
jgi:uncharacterized protein with LGFP repeats